MKHKDRADVGGDANKYIEGEISCICIFIAHFVFPIIGGLCAENGKSMQ